MMLNHNKLLYKLLDKTFTIVIGSKEWTNNYTEGDLFELWDYLSQKDIKYPIIWLQTGYDVKASNIQGNGRITLSNCRLFFICKGDENDQYQKRFDTTYTDMLYPLVAKFLKFMNRKSGIILSDDYTYKAFPFNDVNELLSRESNGKRNSEKATIQDIWDSVYLELDIHLDKDCFQEFIIK